MKRFVYFDYTIDPETAKRTRLDPPTRMTALEYLEKLPLWIADELLFLAWANLKLDALPDEAGFRPHWEQSYLLDAFLRDCPLSTEDQQLSDARDTWRKEWRTLALIALHNGLAPYGLTLQDIAIDNTVFRVLSADKQVITDRHCDSVVTRVNLRISVPLPPAQATHGPG